MRTKNGVLGRNQTKKILLCHNEEHGILPDAGEYFVTWEAKNSGSRFIEIAEYFMNDYGDMVWDVSRMEKNGYHDIKIIAWMDMPKRWEGD